ncbi:hypothetical protein POL68_00025 [Stigmatella sp. ncwal1]|uniref:Lipoprotein n=1 Tax=Stigmatella ashevillensis TaxID=2995309 RepID=A0ABT5D1A6_9BACT|nr:hypothetical protein [Stigmatella ashevillena]MDC0706850.1 hypothetical protein [Stigmatella ashevillena]
MRAGECRERGGLAGSGWRLCLLPLLWACSNSGTEGTPITLTSVTPATMSSSECIDVEVGLTGDPPFTLDYGTSTAQTVTVTQVSIGQQGFPVSSLRRTAGGFTLPLPSEMPEGKQDVRVLLSDKRELVLPGGFEVTAPLRINGFTIDYVLDQYPGEPFSLVIRAAGEDAVNFRGKGRLSAGGAVLQPEQSAAFDAGVLKQQVTLLGAPGTVFIQMEDCTGLQTQSNDFRLLPR